MAFARRRPTKGAAEGQALAVSAALALLAIPALCSAPASAQSASVAGAFVYPVGDELDFTKPHEGEGYGYYVSDGYLARRGRKKQRVHQGVDLSNGRGGAPVRAIATGVVVIADHNALIKTRKKQKLSLPTVVDGKRTYKTSWRWRTAYKWRTGWGNYVVIRHTLPSGETVRSLYGHLQPKSVTVKQGDMVAAGQVIGKVGRTGRASSSHLHLEIRRTEAGGVSEEVEDEDQATPEERTFARFQTVDPIAFLEGHVQRFEDLKPDTWQARYALAATRDGIVMPDRDRFHPDRTVNRREFYRTLLSAFRPVDGAPPKDWHPTVDALVDAEILDPATQRSQNGDEVIPGSEAVEILLRCLDRYQARGYNLSAIDAMQVSRDFNRQFAGAEAALAVEKEARAIAAAETKSRRKAEALRVARAQKAAKAAGKKSRVKAKTVKPVAPVPLLDPGFDSLAQSEKGLTRAESCLLLATALRLGTDRISALQRAATRAVSHSG